MSDREFWRAMKRAGKEKFDSDRQRFLEEAKASDDGSWTKHTEYHWQKTVNGHLLDYWPSRRKWMYKGKVSRGNVRKFIEGVERRASKSDEARKAD